MSLCKKCNGHGFTYNLSTVSEKPTYKYYQAEPCQDCNCQGYKSREPRDVCVHRAIESDPVQLVSDDVPGPGGANHVYYVRMPRPPSRLTDGTWKPDDSGLCDTYQIKMQNGPVKEVGTKVSRTRSCSPSSTTG